MARMIELTDTLDGRTAVVPIEDVAAELRSWFELGEDFIPENDIEAKIDEFQTALLASDYAARELAAYLAVGFYEVQA